MILRTQKYGRYGHSTVDLGKDKVLILGGQNGFNVQNDILTFDSDSNTIYQTGIMRTQRINFKAVRLLTGEYSLRAVY
ncbi:kelch repeat-containing protein [Leptospira yasudae]|uniref:kelch repeat-containing protein n=1 Tax=Leptospira yasudae TaxID=2202201 RepID=UPI00384D2EA3